MDAIKNIDIKLLSPFGEICRKICLNIPDSYAWQWDHKRNLALITMDKQDAELVFFPLFREFKEHWTFMSSCEAEMVVARLLNAEFGLMPGQTFFASCPIQDLFLFVAWWPWGDTNKVSMRVGLFSMRDNGLPPSFAHACLRRWLKIKHDVRPESILPD